MEVYDRPTTSHRVYSDLVFSETSVTTRNYPPTAAVASASGASPLFQINIKFSGFVRFSDFFLYQDSTDPQYVREIDLALRDTSVLLNLPQFFSSADSRETIDRGIKENWPRLPNEKRRRVVGFALKKAREVLGSMPARHNVVHLHIIVGIIYKLVYVERPRRSMDWAIQRSMDAYEVRMIPAEDSSIKSLKRRKILATDSMETNCSICLEEFSTGSEVICMACSHLFHEDCIKKWLRTSHYCPLCRFELPASC